MRRLMFVTLTAALVAPAPARAADPVAPLSDVRPGMRCTALTVIHGVDITPFDVEVLDVLDRERGTSARILVRVSGAAVDATGLGPGFSGSPILCTGDDGIARNIGAISETIGEYGGRIALATPIEAILAQPVLPPAATRSARSGRSEIIGAQSLASPLTIAGLRPSLAGAFVRAARKAGRMLIAAPAGTRAAFARQPLAPGAAVSVGLTSGDILLGSTGTVAYRDGANVWLYGHQLDAAGRRALFLQDTYIHAVINNPIAVPDVSTYKLGSPGNDLGAVTSDGPTAVAGTLGAPPPSFPLRVTAKDLQSGRERSTVTQVADEGDVGRPSGVSALGLAAAAGAAEAAAGILDGGPARQTGELCVKVALRELRAPLRVCNRYAVDGASQNALAGAAAEDVAAAVDLLESYKFATLHPTSVEIGLRVRRGLRQAYILAASGPSAVRRGRTIRVRLLLRRTGSGAMTVRTLAMRVPLAMPKGPRTLRLVGTPADTGSDPDEGGEHLAFIFEGPPEGADEPGPLSLRGLRAAFEDLARPDGVTARLGTDERQVLSDPRLRISGQARVRLRIR
jgi:hypothetical protein